MKKYLIITGILSLFLALVVSAGTINFGATVATNTATSTYNIVSPINTKTLTYDSFAEGANAKADVAYVLLQQVASSSASVLGITVQFSQNGQEWYSNNLSATSSTANPIILDTAPSYTLTGNAVSSTTRVAFKLETPTRFTRLTFTGLTGTSSVYAQVIPVTGI